MKKILFMTFIPFLGACTTISGLTGKQIIEKDMKKQETKGALVVCIKGEALLYGGGKIIYARAAKGFKGTVIVKDCDVKITDKTDGVVISGEEVPAIQ